MKKIFAIAVLLFAVPASYARTTLDNGRVVSAVEAAGPDRAYDFDAQDPVVKAPKGYKAVYIEHYGRHGSRYAYSSKYYKNLKKALDKASQLGVLTPFGDSLKADFDSHYDHYIMRKGDLSEIGWNQQERLGMEMARNYPSVFRQPGASVYACSSTSRRSMMSMAGFCVGLAKVLPELPVRADQGVALLDETLPRDKENPYLAKMPEQACPFTYTQEEFCRMKTGNFPQILERLFTDPSAVVGGNEEIFLIRLYVLVSGMNSLNPEDRTDFSGLMTEEEYARMWEVDNYERYCEYYPYLPKTVPIIEHILEDAGEALDTGRRGARLRFGHDHVIMPLHTLLSINGYTAEPSSPDDVSAVFANIDSPMAANIQIVFYRGGGPDLVTVRANGRYATIDGLTPVQGPFYKWSDYSAVLSETVRKYSEAL